MTSWYLMFSHPNSNHHSGWDTIIGELILVPMPFRLKIIRNHSHASRRGPDHAQLGPDLSLWRHPLAVAWADGWRFQARLANTWTQPAWATRINTYRASKTWEEHVIVLYVFITILLLICLLLLASLLRAIVLQYVISFLAFISYILYIYMYTDWWFGTFFPYTGNNHPNWRTHIFQRGRLKPPTSIL
jgi:hypothetical protein